MNEFTLFDHLENLDLESKYLVHKAKEALHYAYAPYSRFTVGAAVLLEDSSVITGTNQENAAYPSGMCAERVALFALSAQHTDKVIKKLAVVARPKNGKDLVPATSCGSCRQVMLEYEQRQHQPFQIIMLNAEHQWVLAGSARSLLPYCFTPDHLPSHGKRH